MTIVKSELITRLAKRQASTSEKDISAGVNIILNKLGEVLAAGNRAEIRDFGSFSLHYRPPRYAHNPRTGKKVTTKAKYSPHFKPGKSLRERVNNSRKHTAIIDDHKQDRE